MGAAVADDKPAVFKETNGTKITLTPGNTWEELVPSTIRVGGAIAGALDERAAAWRPRRSAGDEPG